MQTAKKQLHFNRESRLVLYGLPLVYTLLCFAAAMLLFGMRYELNDDAIISNIAAGAYGGSTQYLVYVNILYGFFLKPFYLLAPGLNWFVVLQVAAALACFWALGVLLAKQLGPVLGGICHAMLLAFAGVDFFARFHYVKYGGLFIATGLVFIMAYLGRWRLPAFAGAALVLLGSMLRFQQFVSIGGLAAPLLLFLFFKLDKPGKKRAAAWVGGVVALAFVLYGIHALAYNSHAGWREYRAFNAARTEISDFKDQFADGPEDLGEGYSETDYEMVMTWNFGDPEVFSTETVEAIADTLPGNSFLSAVKTTVYTVAQMLYSSPLQLLLAAVIAGYLFLSGRGKRLAFWGTLLMLVLEVFYLSYVGRLPASIFFSLTLTSVLFLAACVEVPPAGQGNTAKSAALIAAVLLVCSVTHFTTQREVAQDYYQSRLPRAEAFDEIAADTGTLYLADSDLVDAANGYDVWHTRKEGYFSNIVFTGSWLMHAPFETDTLAAYGVDNPYPDSLDNPNVLYLDFYHRELKEDYLQQHYNENATLERVAEYNDFNSYCAVTTGAAGQEETGAE